mmetsp:Transcript_24123/g.74729  ORF Transcript_24123/g.74729 Transcript_24123/m.74729 type:complete len:105 (-) Transcript_24123:277-591(-)
MSSGCTAVRAPEGCRARQCMHFSVCLHRWGSPRFQAARGTDCCAPMRAFSAEVDATAACCTGMQFSSEGRIPELHTSARTFPRGHLGVVKGGTNHRFQVTRPIV